MNPSQYGRLALAFSIGGTLVAMAVELTVAHAQPGIMVGYLIFLVFQIAAFVLGISTWKDSAGKTACITSAVLACGSLLSLA